MRKKRARFFIASRLDAIHLRQGIHTHTPNLICTMTVKHTESHERKKKIVAVVHFFVPHVV